MENPKIQEQPVAPVQNQQMEETMEQAQTEEIAVNANKARFMVIGAYAILMVLGVATGFGLSKSVGKTSIAATAGQKAGYINTGKVAGITDTRTFKDSAVGVIQKGGFNGEGTHNLVRDGGPSQTVYLVSSAVDLDQYVGKQVKIWGQTMAAKKVAWLMDVGKIELQ